MVGLGTQDSQSQAEDFVAQFGVTFPMTWDPSARSWNELGIASQPAAVLISADGQELARYRGAIDEGDVLSRI